MSSYLFELTTKILEEPYQVLFDVDYECGYPQYRYPTGLPRKCPSSGVWARYPSWKNRMGEALVACPVCGRAFLVKEYQRGSRNEASKDLNRG